MRFEPVWVSSANHLKEFQSVVQKTSWLRQAIGFYKMPPDFPCFETGYGFFSFRMPTIVLSHGQLDVEERSIHFQTTRWDFPAGKKMNLLSDWSFELKADTITSIEKFEKDSSDIRHYDMNFTRVQTNYKGMLSDFLLCAGESGPSLEYAQHRGEELYRELLQLKS